MGRNEEYRVESDGGLNASSDNLSLTSFNTGVLTPANGRAYAVFSDGYCHGQSTCSPTPPSRVAGNAYVPGWPVKVAILDAELLPYVGSGVDTAPAMASFPCPQNSSPGLRVAVFASDGPAYVFGSDGKSCYGQGIGPDGQQHDRSLGTTESSGNVTDIPYTNAFGTAAIGDLSGSGDLVLATATSGLNKALDVVVAEHQLYAENSVTAWSVAGPVPTCPGCVPGKAHPGYPHYMNDLQFLAGPAIADITGAGSQEVIEGSASVDLRAVDGMGNEVWDKNVGGWTVDTPAVATIGADQHQKVATLTREGDLFVYQTTAGACAGASWPKYKHDVWNSGEFETRAGRPATITNLSASTSGTKAKLSFTAPHGNLFCDNATAYEVRYSTSGPVTDANWSLATLVQPATKPAAAGTPDHIALSKLPAGVPIWFEVQAVNGASRSGGNLGAISNSAQAGRAPLSPLASPTTSVAQSLPLAPSPFAGGASAPFASAGTGSTGCAIHEPPPPFAPNRYR